MGVSGWRQLGGYACLLLPICAVLSVPLYSRAAPYLLGLPFFYWYLLAWVLITPALMFVAYVLMREHRTAGPDGTTA